MVRIRSRRTLLVLVAATLACFLTWLAVCFALLVHPRVDEPAKADAVVMLGGSSGARLDTAVSLMDQGLAGTLVISTPRDSSSRRSLAFCAAPHPYPVTCFVPDPSTTRGEAEEIDRLSAANDWHSVMVVTSLFHLARARMTVARCYSGELRMIPAAHERIPLRQWAYQFAYQTAGWLQAQLHRHC